MSRRSRALLFALCLLLALVLVLLDHTHLKLGRLKHTESDEKFKALDFEKYHAKTFTVVNVVDGDTFDIDIPNGQYEQTRIRLWGLDTPETKNDETGVMYFGPEACEFTKKLTLGKQLTVYLEKHRTRGKYGRLLAYVQLPDGRFLNEVLLSEGYAYADLRFEHSLYYKYKRIEAAARSAKKGLWKKVTPDQLPKWLQRKQKRLNN